MISIIITSYKEPKTIGKAIRCIALPDCEIIQISPDSETLNAGLKVAQELNLGKNFKQIKDPYKGKPHALNMAFKKASGDILVLTDGDVFFDKDAVSILCDYHIAVCTTSNVEPIIEDENALKNILVLDDVIHTSRTEHGVVDRIDVIRRENDDDTFDS